MNYFAPMPDVVSFLLHFVDSQEVWLKFADFLDADLAVPMFSRPATEARNSLPLYTKECRDSLRCGS